MIQEGTTARREEGEGGEGEHVRLQVRKITEIRHILSTVY